MGLKNYFKIQPKHSKYVRPVIGSLCILFGIVFMAVPFIPLGYILLFGGLFLLTPYIPGADKLLNKIKSKDKKNRVENAQNHVSDANDRITESLSKDRNDGEELPEKKPGRVPQSNSR